MTRQERDADWHVRELLAQLSQVSMPSKLSGLAEYVDRAETVAFHHVTAAALQFVIDSSRGTLKKSESGWIFDSQSQGHFMVGLACDAFDPKLLVLTCSRLGGDRPPKTTNSRYDLAPPGKYKTLELLWAAELAYLSEPLGVLVKRLCDEASNYIAETILSRLNSGELRVAKQLYDLLRIVVTDSETRAKVWFATVGPEYGFRLVDDAAGSGALKAIYAGVGNDAVSPERVLAQLVQTRLPREMLLMDISAKSGSVIDGDIPKAGYAQQGLSYTYVMHALYHSDNFCIFPVYRADPIAVFALFPSDLDSVRNLLANNASRFAEVASRLVEPIIEAASLFDSELPPGNVPIPQTIIAAAEVGMSSTSEPESPAAGIDRENLGLLLFKSLAAIRESRGGTYGLRRSGTRLGWVQDK